MPSRAISVAGPADDIRLVVQITVDGLRGDLLSRYEPSFKPDNFRRLIEAGVWHTDAHHPNADNEMTDAIAKLVQVPFSI